MKLYNLIFCICISLLFACSKKSSVATTPTSLDGMEAPQESRLQKKSNMLAQELGLTEKETEKLMDIEEKYQEKRMKLRKSGSTDRAATFEEVKKLKVSQDEETKKMLGDEKWAKYEMLMEQRKEKMGKKGMGEPRKG